MSVLAEICACKAYHVAARKQAVPLEALKEQIPQAHAPRKFIGAIRNSAGTAVIAEIKKASPSKGVIRADFDPVEIAKTYEENGAACLSVLTDEPYFQGHDDYLQAVKKQSALPVLRKDFMIDPYQIYESRALGADCILLIMAALNDEQAKNLYNIATGLGMDVLVEVHDAPELERALHLNPDMIGINNRNLKTLQVDTNTSIQLAPHMPQDIVKIAESGIAGKNEIAQLKTAGFDGFLIGESLMRQQNIGAALKALL